MKVLLDAGADHSKTDNVSFTMFVIIIGQILVLLLTHDKDLVLHSAFHLLVILYRGSVKRNGRKKKC